MYIVDRAILLRKSDWNDSSFIVEFMSEKNSKISAKIFGLKKKNISFNEGSIFNIEYLKSNRNLKTIKNISIYKLLKLNIENYLYNYSLIELIKFFDGSNSDMNKLFNCYNNSLNSISNDFEYISMLISIFLIEGIWGKYEKCSNCNKNLEKYNNIEWIGNEIFCSSCLRGNGIIINKRLLDFFTWSINGDYDNIKGKILPFNINELRMFLLTFIEYNISCNKKIPITRRVIEKINL